SGVHRFCSCVGDGLLAMHNRLRQGRASGIFSELAAGWKGLTFPSQRIRIFLLHCSIPLVVRSTATSRRWETCLRPYSSTKGAKDDYCMRLIDRYLSIFIGRKSVNLR